MDKNLKRQMAMTIAAAFATQKFKPDDDENWDKELDEFHGIWARAFRQLLDRPDMDFGDDPSSLFG